MQDIACLDLTQGAPITCHGGCWPGVCPVNTQLPLHETPLLSCGYFLRSFYNLLNPLPLPGLPYKAIHSFTDFV